MILQKLKPDAEAYLGEPVTEAVITVPAYFTDAQRQATKDAGQIAGLDVKRIINEPTAAALAYGLDKGRPTRRSWSTTSAAAPSMSPCWRSATASSRSPTAGNNRLGGDDFDQCITNYLVEEFKKSRRALTSRATGWPCSVWRSGREGEDRAVRRDHLEHQPAVHHRRCHRPEAPRRNALACQVQ